VYFELLQSRLLQRLRIRMRNGELTERSLARLTGVSQPHVHNVLKGVRILSPEIADVILQKLGMSLLDLIEPDEFETAIAARNAPRTFARVPLLEGFVGPGHAWPEKIAPGDGVWIAGNETRGLRHITATRLARDPDMNATEGLGRIALLDVSESGRSALDPNSYYAVSHDSQSYIRKLRTTTLALYMLTDSSENAPDTWVRVEANRGLTEVVRGKVLFILTQWLTSRRCSAFPLSGAWYFEVGLKDLAGRMLPIESLCLGSSEVYQPGAEIMIQ
jgi:transcriptional regulator with XRE-family HTH domain